MNVHVLGGLISFILWSAFSVWIYISFVLNENPKEPESEQIPIVTASAALPADTLSIKAEALPKPIEFSLEREFYFELNSDNPLDPTLVSQFADSLAALKSASLYINITGYACDLGTEKFNESLGQKRAEKIKSLLGKSLGTEILTRSEGESNPRVSNTSEANRSKNRRTVLTVKTTND